MIPAFIVLAIILALAYLPSLWVQRVIRENSAERQDIPGTGGELARHLLDGMKLHHVKVEETQIGDHYDPEAKAVRLMPDRFNGRSLAAIVVAAHEVGHAMQDATGYTPLAARTKIAKQARYFEMAGVAILFAAPVVMALLRAPHALLFDIAAGLAVLGVPIMMHALTLPVEFDASFRRAMPVLEQGGFIAKEDVPAARLLLRAAAFTYVAAAAFSLLNVARWLTILRI